MSLRVTVIGTGYLGATHAACLAHCGCHVLGVDTDAAKVDSLSAGNLPFYEPGLRSLVKRYVALGTLRFTTSMAEAAEFGDVHFLCVGTPQRDGALEADLRQLEQAVDTLAESLTRQCLLVGKSTVPVGTAERLLDRLRAAAPAGADVDLAWNPEFLREGHAVTDTLRPDRIVVGVRSTLAETILREVYSLQLGHGIPFIVTDLATAELTKLAANSFLAMKLSFVNAMAEVCEMTGADIVELADAIGCDPRIGRDYLESGLGFGGGCLPKDIRAFRARTEELGAVHAAELLAVVDAINIRRRKRMVELTTEACGGAVAGRRIGVLGAAFKPHSDDVRDSPALAVAVQLQRLGATVRVYDPAATGNARALFPHLEYSTTALGAAARADVLLHLTEWPEFRLLDPREVSRVVTQREIVDGRNSLDGEWWRNAGWTYRGLGRSVTSNGRLADYKPPVSALAK